MNKRWENFWYEWKSVQNPRMGGRNQSWRVFRTQRLKDIILVIILITIFVILIVK